jgi:integrase
MSGKKRKLRGGGEVTVHDNDGIRKICGCPRGKWAKCTHPWHFSFAWKGSQHRFSLNRHLGTADLSKTEAEREAEKLRIAIRGGSFLVAKPEVTPDTPVETLETYARAWLQMATQKLKASTGRFYRDNLENHVIPAIGAVPLTDMNRVVVKRFIRALLEKRLKRNTVNGIVRTLSTILSEAVEDERLPANPAFRPGRHLKDPNAPKKAQIDPYTREEVAQLLDVSQEHFAEWHPFVMCAVRTGLRLGELRALEWGDFDWRQRFIRVERNWVEGKLTTPKNGMARNVDMSLQLRAVLRLWRRYQRISWFERGAPMPQLVFPSETGAPLDDSNLRKVMLTIVEKAQVRRHRSIVHVMRHSFASLLLQQGESLMYVKEQMGHSSINITADVYGHLIPGANREAVDRLDDSSARLARTLQAAPPPALRRPA